MVLGEIGKLPVSDVIRSIVLSFWFKIVTCSNDRKLVCIMYKLARKMFENHDIYVSKWLKYVKTSLDELGLSFLWISQDLLVKEQLDWFKNTVHSKISDSFMAKWRASVYESPSCINYRLFKSTFSCELYIKKLPTFLAITLMKFRCRNTKLPVFKNRYDPLHSTSCTLCDSGQIGDEFHVLLNCEFFKEERKIMLGKERFQHANMLLFSEIMNYNSEIKIRKLARFVRTISLVYK